MAGFRVGLIGVGGRGVGFGRRLLELPGRCELAGMAEPNAVRARAAAEQLGVSCPLHTNAAELVARPDVDAVVITSVDALHREHAVAALQGGKHVFIDKPLATTTADCLAVAQAAEESGRVLYMGFNMRHDPVLMRLKRIADEGGFGKIFSVQALEFYNGGKTYMARWNRLKKHSGGLWVHKGSHDFDILNWLIGARPARVSAFASVSVLNPEGLPFELQDGEEAGPCCARCAVAHKCPDRRSARGTMFGDEAESVDGYRRDLCIYVSDKDTHDQGVAIVEYDNGVTAQHSEYFVTAISTRRYFVLGDRGQAEADLTDSRIAYHPRWGHEDSVINIRRGKGGHGGADSNLMTEFLDCIERGTPPRATAADGVWSVAVGEAAEISRAEKRVVEIRELLDPDDERLR
jgi:predicted dehydrogenase